MSNFRLQFSGEIKKFREFQMGAKNAVELQLMKKNYTPKDQEASFTWIKVLVIDPKPFQLGWMNEGQFIAGSGEMSLTSFVGKDDQKKHTVEVRCSSFDIDAPYTGEKEAPAPRQTAPRKPAPANDDDDGQSPPF